MCIKYCHYNECKKLKTLKNVVLYGYITILQVNIKVIYNGLILNCRMKSFSLCTEILRINLFQQLIYVFSHMDHCLMYIASKLATRLRAKPSLLDWKHSGDSKPICSLFSGPQTLKGH